MSWYTLQTAHNCENRAQRALERLAQTEGLANDIRQIVVPTRDETTYRDGKKRTASKPLFPGYVFVEMEMSAELHQLARSVAGARDFICVHDDDTGGYEPAPMSEVEVQQFLQAETPAHLYDLMPGDVVSVTDGPFKDMTVTVTHKNANNGELTANASIFGRETPITIHASHVIRV